MLLFFVLVGSGAANSNVLDHQFGHVKAAEWQKFTPQQKLWWVRGFVEGVCAGKTVAFYQFGISDPAQNSQAIKNTLFSRCTTGRSSVELAHAFDQWLQAHPEDLDNGIHAVFFAQVVDPRNCPEPTP
jgi:hypothetical protein